MSTEKPLKRGKSLTRSLSTAFRKSGRSPPTSPLQQDVPTPPTPQLPEFYRPQTADSHQKSTPVFELVLNEKNENDQSTDVADGAIGLGKEPNQPEKPSLHVKKKRSIRNLSLRHSRQKSWTTGDDATRPRAASVPDTQPNDSAADGSATKQKKVKPKTSLRIAGGRISNQERSASATIPIPKSSPALAQLSRPATYGPSLPSPASSTKSRQRGNSSPRNAYSRTYTDSSDLPPSPHLAWQAPVRSSFRSAVTATSSRTNTTRNSVITKDTALTDVTVDSPTRADTKDEEDEGMTVDEAIEMYAVGFTDDPEESRDSSLSDEERRRSAKIAEAISDNMNSSEVISSTPTSARPSTSGSTRSKTFRSASLGQSTLSHGTTFPYGASRDQYGFLKYNNYITRTVYDTWFAEYYPSQVRRGHKWTLFMKAHKLPTDNPTKFPGRSAKTHRYVRKGIPPAWRGAAWFYYAGGDSYLARHPQLYNNLVHLSDQKLEEDDKDAIERDLHRTFPDNIRFKPEPGTSNLDETDVLASLRRVLRAFALHNPKIGYCQSLNFIAALLLLFMSEEKCFWMLHIITLLYLPATHEVSLEGANIDLHVLDLALRRENPAVWAKVGETGVSEDRGKRSRLPPISLCTTSWFMSLFIGTLPVETVLRVWDVLFAEGSRTLFRVAVAIFKIGEQNIKSVADPMELFQIVQSLPRGMVHASKFMDVACRKVQVGADWVERARGERRIQLAKQRANAPGTLTLAENMENEGNDQKEKFERKKSIWKKRTADEKV